MAQVEDIFGCDSKLVDIVGTNRNQWALPPFISKFVEIPLLSSCPLLHQSAAWPLLIMMQVSEWGLPPNLGSEELFHCSQRDMVPSSLAFTKSSDYSKVRDCSIFSQVLLEETLRSSVRKRRNIELYMNLLVFCRAYKKLELVPLP